MFQRFNMIAMIAVTIIIIPIIIIFFYRPVWLLSCDDSLQRCRGRGDDDWYCATRICRATLVVVSTALDPCWTDEAGDRLTTLSTRRSISVRTAQTMYNVMCICVYNFMLFSLLHSLGHAS